ncbi:MAG: hypothetical protein DRJ34_02055 [Thermoprotei archaeon]|nr:MAG: hypothetical protein DRJ34_02055 [Thermoprotei archaeon]RLE73459.1 MAG: hypothetical protein DRJ45_00195 [Thermoprotei archaeon]
MDRKIFLNRLGGLPPIISVIITVASLITAALVGYWLWYTTITATKRPLLSIEGSASIVGSDLYITIRNDGNIPVNIEKVIVSINGGSGSEYTPSATGNGDLTLNPGETETILVALSSAPNKSDRVSGTVITSGGQLPFSALVVGG